MRTILLFLLFPLLAEAQPLLFGAGGNGTVSGSASGTYVTGTFSVTSTIDAGQLGSGRFRYDVGFGKKPLVIFLHGWGDSQVSLTDADLSRWASYGFFAASIQTRQNQNVGGREVYDIYDIVQCLLKTYPAQINAQKISFVGYSNGGGTGLQLACKFPDLFAVTVAHFPMSDFGYDASYGWYQTNPDAQASIITRMGGTPTQVPSAYRARNAVEAITNYQGFLYDYHDADDNLVSVVHSRRIRDVFSGSGRYSYAESNSSSGVRYLHGYPSAIAGLVSAEADWKGKVLRSKRPAMPISGTLRVIGYVKTDAFSLWLGDGTSGTADLTYNTTSRTYTITPLTGNTPVTITQGSYTVTQTISSQTTLVLP